MKSSAKSLIVFTVVTLLLVSRFAFPQSSPNRYEVETLRNPNPGKKDTREVNAVLIFDKDVIKVQSRRSKEVFKEFKLSEIRTVEHSYSKKPFFSPAMAAAIAFSVVT